MLEVCTMPSHDAEPLKCESYATTPRSVTNTGRISKSKNLEEDLNADSVNKQDRVQSAPPHFSEHLTQSLTERLLDDSEQRSLDDILLFDTAVIDDWSEAASGWGAVVPYAKYVTNNAAARNRSESLRKGSYGPRKPVRCIDEDLGGEPLSSPWRANVEPVTYRYIPNNGYYRNNKPSKDDIREWIAVKKSRSEKSLVTPEVRQAQRTLKRDLEYHFKPASQDTPLIPAPSNVPAARILYRNLDPPSQSQTNAPPRVLYRNQAAASSSSAAKPTEAYTTQTPPELYDEHVAMLLASESCGEGTDVSHHARRLPVKEQALIKSASDLFMENFNTRLSALEKEIQTPYAPAAIKKTVESTTAPTHSPTQLSKKLREVRMTDTMRPTIQNTKQHSMDIGEDLFSVVPVKREVPLRPLEKLTPKHRQMEKDAFSQDRLSTPELIPGEGEEDEDMIIMLAAATSQPHSLPKDNDTSDIGTARSAIAMTNSDIEKMRSVPIRSDFSNVPKPFYVHKGGGAVSHRKGAMRYSVRNNSGRNVEQTAGQDSTLQEGFPSQVERQTDKNLETVGQMLPEIMGKRLTVATTTHRLL